MKISKLVCFVFLALIHAGARADDLRQPTDWVALQVNEQIMSAQEVRRYIDTVVISSDLHRALFEEAGRDFSTYQQKKETLIEELFAPTLDRISVVRLLQAEATKKAERRYFAITKRQMKDVIDENIRRALNKFRPRGGALAEARDFLISDLKDSGMPFDSSAPATDVYYKWVERVSTRLREEYRQHEASRYLCSQGGCAKVTPIEAFIKKRPELESKNFVVLRPSANIEIRQKDAFDRLVSLEQNGLTATASSKLADGIKDFFYLGRIVENRVEFLHINDFNLTGPVGEALGFPRTNDSGRTSGFVLNLKRTGEQGSFTIQFENWLFTDRLKNLNKRWRQILEEENTVRLVSRHFLDEKGNKWVLVGISGTYRTQRAGIGAMIQHYFHQMVPGNPIQINLERNGQDLFFEGLFGVGGQFSIIETPHVDLVLSGEAILSPAAAKFVQSNVRITPSLDLNFYGRTKELPIFRISLFSELGIHASGEYRTVFGGRIMAGVVIKRVRVEAGLYIVRWDDEMDRRYEKAASWTTGIIVMVSHAPDRKKPTEYEL